MTQRTTAEIGFVKFSNSDFVFENPEQDIRGKDVYDTYGEQIGSVDDLYIDTEVGEVRVTIEPGREKVAGSSPFDASVVAPTTAYQRRRQAHDDYDYIDPSRTPPRT
jgi:hypothetical protein